MSLEKVGPFAGRYFDEIFRGVPKRFRTNLFQKTLRVVSISKEKGINVFHCTTDVTERR